MFLLFDMLPVPNTFFISFTVSESNSFLFVIIVFDIDADFPVFVTLYPFSFNSSTAFSSFSVSPLPFNTSSLISDLSNFAVDVVLDDVFVVLFVFDALVVLFRLVFVVVFTLLMLFSVFPSVVVFSSV